MVSGEVGEEKDEQQLDVVLWHPGTVLSGAAHKQARQQVTWWMWWWRGGGKAGMVLEQDFSKIGLFIIIDHRWKRHALVWRGNSAWVAPWVCVLTAAACGI